MIKKAVILLTFLLLVAGCDDSGDTAPVESVFKGGTTGLVAEFEPFGILEDGTYTIFEGEEFPIEIIIMNKGEEDLNPGDVTAHLKGINIDDFSGISASNLTNEETIEKVDEFNLNGDDEEIIDFTPSGGASYTRNITGFYKPEIIAFVDYNYKTHLIIPEVCFKEDLRDESICEVQETKDFYVSSAPITVTSVEQDMGGRGIVVLLISVENAQEGKVTIRGKDFDPRYGMISYTVKNDADKWECRSGGRQNEARLNSLGATIICKLKEPLEEDTLHTSQVELELSYRYQTILRDSIKIKEDYEDS